MLTIEPILGLANRMRAIDSAVGLSAHLGLPLRVVWPRGRGMGCRFDDLFIAGDEIAEVREVDQTTLAGRIVSRVRSLARLDPVPDFDWPAMERYIERGFDFTSLEGVPSLHLRSFNRFCRSPAPYAALRPLPEIANRVAEVVGRFGNTTGVHIRRTDNAQAIRESSDDLFVRRIEAEIARDDTATFFLATDDPAVENLIRSTFSDRIIVYPKRSRDRRTVQANQDALIDLLCLASTTHLLGSFYSSFSEVAAEIGGMQPEIVRPGTSGRLAR